MKVRITIAVWNGSIGDLLNAMSPILDNLRIMLGPEKTQSLLQDGKIHIQPLAMIRGRSLSDAVLVVDESQNLTALEAKTIITRAGENCVIFMTGDTEQIDNPDVDRYSNGLTYVADRMGLERMVAVVPFSSGKEVN